MSQYFDNKNELFIEPRVSQYGSHMVMTNVHKEDKKKYINIDTRFSDEYSTSPISTSVAITFPERINDVKNVFVSTIEVPISYYNISKNLGNHSFTIVKNSTSYPIIVPDGQYSDNAALQLAIRTQITNSGVTDISFAIVDNHTTFTFLNTVSGSAVVDFDTDASGNFDKNQFKSKLGWLLGFRDQQISISYSSRISKSSAFVNLATIRYLYLVLDEFSKGNQNSFVCPLYTSRINKNIIARIAVDSTPFGHVLVANTWNGYLQSDRRSYTGKVDLLRMNVGLIDEFGRAIDLNGLDYSFCMEVLHE